MKVTIAPLSLAVSLLSLSTGCVAVAVNSSAAPMLLEAETLFVCGVIELSNGVTQKMYEGACYELMGVARAVSVDKTCECEFFPFKSCNTVGVVRQVSGASIRSVKGYYCQKTHIV